MMVTLTLRPGEENTLLNIQKGGSEITNSQSLGRRESKVRFRLKKFGPSKLAKF